MNKWVSSFIGNIISCVKILLIWKNSESPVNSNYSTVILNLISLLWDPWDLHVPESVFVFFILWFLLLLTFFLSFVFPFFLFFLWVILFGCFRYHVFERHNTLYNMIALHSSDDTKTHKVFSIVHVLTNSWNIQLKCNTE